jgi:hypothetical protein
VEQRLHVVCGLVPSAIALQLAGPCLHTAGFSFADNQCMTCARMLHAGGTGGGGMGGECRTQAADTFPSGCIMGGVHFNDTFQPANPSWPLPSLSAELQVAARASRRQRLRQRQSVWALPSSATPRLLLRPRPSVSGRVL